MAVDALRADYERTKGKWQRLRDCFDGRDAVLGRGKEYIPDLPGADTAQNANYRARGNFYNAVARTVQGMNGMVYQIPPVVEMPDAFTDYLLDVTLSNVPFETFAMETGKEIFLTGRYGILVDMPEEDAEDNRPYLVGYKAEQITNWRSVRRGGDEVLSMVVLLEKVEVTGEKDPFEVGLIEQFRVVMLNEAGQAVRQLWRKRSDKDKEWVQFGGDKILMRRGEALTFVPFTFMGALSPTPELKIPPLIDLADVNLGHWRNSVDHEYGLHLVALPTPWIAGSKGAAEGSTMKIGPSVVWELEVTGKAGMLEFTGAGLSSLSEAMEEKKKQMATLCARLLEDQPSTQETASGVRLRHSAETASVRTIAQSQEQGFIQALQIVVWWAGTDAKPQDAEVTVELNKEYLNVKASPEEVRVALTALQAGEMSFETWYHFLEVGGWTREGITVEDEKKDISQGE